MRLFGRHDPPRTIVRTYGRDSFLAFLNPVMTFLVRSMGLEMRLRSDAEVAARMEDDAIVMRQQGYRVVSAEEYTMPLFGARYFKVTYERSEPPD